MNTMVRSAVVFVSIVLLNFLQIESKLSKSPAAVTVVRVGSFVKLECFTENKTYPAVWTHLSVGSSSTADVNLVVLGDNNEILGRMTDTYHNRGFMVKENRETGEYRLEIQSVKVEDAGEYKCLARGGLGQSASAQLTVVIDSPPVCESNVTEEVLGPNSCGKDPDTIALTCNFGVHGNSLPNVMWVKTEHLDSVVKVGPAQWTDEPGRAISMFIAEARRKDLTESSFTCIVQTSDSVENKMRFSCKTPRIDVLEIANTTEYRTVSEPEEVQCDPSSFTNGVSCKWVRREDDVTVSSTQQLNLFRPQMKPGHYVCIVDCDIRGDMCPFEALRINYIGAASEPDPSSQSQASSQVIVMIAIFVGIAVPVSVAVTIVLILRARRKSRLSADNRDATAQEVPLNHAGIDEGDWIGKYEPGRKQARLRALENKANLRMRANALRAEENPGLSMSDESGDVAEGISNTGRGSDVLDMNTPLPSGSRAARLKALEDNASQRMQANAALKGQENAGFSMPHEGDDVAKEIPRSTVIKDE